MEKSQMKNYKIFKIIWKIRTIILSRFKKPQNQEWVELRRSICKNCPHNSKKTTTLSLKVRLTRLLSDFLTWITRAEQEDLGHCTICTCPIFFKSLEKLEKCDAGYWSVYEPNSSETKRGKKIKNGDN